MPSRFRSNGAYDGDADFEGRVKQIKTRKKILLSHEPVYGLPWYLNIRGHDHSNICQSVQGKGPADLFVGEAYQDGCKHQNLAANVCDYTPASLGKLIKDGILLDIHGIHRMTIDRANEKKE